MSNPLLWCFRNVGAGDNIGVGCWRSRVLGIDLDVKDGIARFAALCDQHSQAWPDTLTVRTPSGGLHLYFTVPADLVIGSTAGRSPGSPLGPGIDTRGPGAGGRGGSPLPADRPASHRRSSTRQADAVDLSSWG
ncbi:bifunctional DNA primase/polymerase [Nonomuraea sp. NPDC050536]|uniref:bifunctional DNA primase/polymerase n=1 Tax=Nonomuraea sp. NPDC050536 TaxID=3364366 RepID=UPI0037CB013D